MSNLSPNHKQIRRNLTAAVVQTLVQALVLFVVYRYLLHTIGIVLFGLWSVVLAATTVCQIASLGMAGSLTKFLAQYEARGDRLAGALAVQTAILSAAVVLAAVLLLAYPALYDLLPRLVPASGLTGGRALLPFALMSSFWLALAGVCQGGLDGSLRSDLRAFGALSGSLLYGVAALVLVHRDGVFGLALAQNGLGVYSLIVSWVLLRRAVPLLPRVPRRWSAQEFRSLLRYGTALQANSIGVLLFEPTTKMLLGHYGSVAMVGYFEMAERAVMKLRAVLVEANSVLVPVFAGVWEVDQPGVRRLYIKNVRALFFIATPAFAALIALSPVVSVVWIGSFQYAFTVTFGTLAGAWYVNTLTAPAYFAYLGLGRLRWNTLSHMVMGGGNLIMGILLGGHFGAPGVVTACVLALLMGSLIAIVAYHREQGLTLTQLFMPTDLRLLISSVAVIPLALGSYAWMHGQAPGSHWTWGLPCALTLAFLGTAVSRHPIGARLGLRAWGQVKTWAPWRP